MVSLKIFILTDETRSLLSLSFFLSEDSFNIKEKLKQFVETVPLT